MKVKKSTRRHTQPPSDVVALADLIVKSSDDDLIQVLQKFDSWKYPRGDLHTWRLTDLLHTSDLEILQSAIFVILRPAQQYANSTPFDAANRHSILHRLLTLSRGWERLTNAGFDMPSLASLPELSLPEDLCTVQIQFYPTKIQPVPSEAPNKGTLMQETPVRPRHTVPANPATPRPRLPTSTGPSTLDFGNVTSWLNPTDKLVALSEDNSVPFDDQYTSLNKIRLARLGDLAIRRQLLTVRLLALATYVYISTDDAAQSGLFLYEPELVPQLAELLRASPQVGEQVTMGALHALDACAHHRVKMGEVMTAYIPRATGLIDSIIFASPQALSNFSNIDGVNFLVQRVKVEIELRDNANLPTSSDVLSEEIWLTRIYRNVSSKSLNNQPNLGQGFLQWVIGAVPSAVGAICLNQSGLDFTIAHPGVIINLISIINVPTHEKIFTDRDSAKSLGAALDELSRHQPLLRPIIMKAMIELLRKATEAGKAFEPSTEDRREYFLDEMNHTEAEAKTDRPVPTNPCLSAFSRIFKVLNGLVRNAATSKDFIKDGGLDYVLGLAELPCLPIRFGSTDAAVSLSSLLRHVGENDQAHLVELIRVSIQQAMTECAEVWQGDDTAQHWNAMNTGTISSKQRQSFKILRSLGFRLSFLSDIIYTLSLPHSRNTAALITALGVDANGEFLANLGRIHRVALHQHILLKRQKLTPSDDIDPTRSQGTADEIAKDSGAKYLATRLHAVFTKFFRTVIKLVHIKRNPDAAHLKQANTLSNVLSDIIIGHFQDNLGSPEKSTGIDTAVLGISSLLLFDSGRGTEGPLHTTLFLTFMKKGGVDHIISTATRIVDRIGTLSSVPVENRDQEQKDLLLEATAGVKVVLFYLNAFATTRSLLDNPETHALQHRATNPIVPVDIFVKLRLKVFPLAYKVWNAQWLIECPLSMVKTAVRCFSTLIEGKSEEPATEEDTNTNLAFGTRLPVISPVVRAVAVTADPSRVDQLVDMGFSRGAAERALVRARNNIAAATDMLLTMPHVFQAEPAVATAPVEQPAAADPAADPADRPAPNTGDSTSAASSLETESTTMQIDTDSSTADRESLQQLREEYRKDLSTRALALLDHAEDLVFDVLPCLPSGEEGVLFLINRLAEVSNSYDSSLENAVSARLRLIAVYLRAADGMMLSEENVITATQVLSDLPLEYQAARPKWLPAFLLFAETIAACAFTVNKVKIGDDTQLDISVPSSAFASVAPKLAKACLQLVSTEDVNHNELVSSLRVLALISREKSFMEFKEDDLMNLLKPFKQPAEKLVGCHPLLLLILRHVIEDSPTLADIMRKEIRHWLTPTRNKVVDIQHFLKQVRQVALRQPTCFVKIVTEECALVNPTPPSSVYHIRAKDEPPEPIPTSAKQHDPFQETPTEDRNPFMDYLISELGQAVRTSLDEESDGTSEAVKHAHSYAGLLMSILTELLGSYTSLKRSFLASVREQGFGSSRSKGGIASLITDLVCCVVLQPDVTGIPPFERGSLPARRLSISSWSISMVLALCSDITPSATVKDVPEDMVNIRKTALDAISKVLRESVTGSNLAVRYGRLWAIGELVYRLLASRPIGSARQINDATLHIAKTMLEKNFVGLLTNALGEIDLNYPDVRNVLVSLLRTLDHLSKTSVKWGKVNKERQNVSEDAPGLNESDTSESGSDSDSDIDMMDEDESAPDLYRNSALGMLGGELGEDDEDEDDDGDDEEDMDMGDDITDDDGDTDLETSDDETMGSDLDADNWTDDIGEEDGSEGEEEMEREVILGTNEDEGAEIWEDNEMMGDEDEDDIHDEVEEPFPSAAHANSMHRQSPDITGPWAWDHSNFANASQARRHRSILAEDPTVSLFGRPSSQPTSQVAQHPLIADPAAQTPAMRGLSRSLGSNYNDLISAIEEMGGNEAVQMLESLITSRQLAGNEAIRIDFAQDHNGTIGLSVGGRNFALHPPHGGRQQSSSNSDVLAEFIPVPTMQRWQEGMQLATSARNELTSRLVVHVINHLMPEARRSAEEEELRNKKEEEEAAKAEAEGQKKELESATGVALPESRQPSPEIGDAAVQEDADVAMEGPASGSLARTLISIHGRDVDITDTGIDLEFLQALPDDMRADVVEQHMREQNRHQRPPAATTDAPETASQINSEFLDALPPEIRAEVIMQEAMENARRNQPAPSMPAANRAAGFLAGLTNELRDVMMLNQPADLSALANDGPSQEPATRSPAKKQHREAIQLLEKPGIASLVRLLFFPETLKKGYLFRVLVNLCENVTTRSDLLNLLLSVVQDGSGDLPAVDRSFQQMSLRGMVTPKATPKGKSVDSPAAAIVPTGLFSHLQTEHVPTFIAQRCFEALAYIVNSNSAAVSYFLTEHEQPVGLRKHPLKKSKGKEKVLPQTKFPIVVLLGLLDRPLLAKTPGMMEIVSSLLVTITKPLAEKRSEDKSNDAANDASKTPPQPVIPAPVLRLIVNCLTAGECTSRTFSSTLVAMQNLACLPDAKDVILQELRTRCKELGGVVQQQLAELASALQDPAAEIGSLTLANFSPPTSTQAQLLRLLKTIDYLHLNKVDSDPPSQQMTDEERAVSAVFESFEFETLWQQLGECLSFVEARGGTDQIATVLLPLVEALMVVSKYRSRSSREVRSPSVPPSNSDLADLFVTFTTTHRKVLNTIVRNNPSLLSGSFSLLIRNPRVLEFDNKRNWFFQKLKRKRDSHIPTSVIPLNIRRQYVFEDSFHAMQRRTGDEIKYGKLSVKFYNEDGVDAGGVTREWYSVLAQQIFDPNFALFEPCAADQQTYQPNKASSVNGDHLAYFKFVGRVIGKAVYDGRLLDAYFNRAFYKQILGRTVDMRDLESIDPEYHKSLQWMLDNDITGVIDQEFTIEDDQFGEKKSVELKSGGASLPVTEENKEEYVRLVVSYRLDNSIKDQIKAFLEGFYDIIPRQIIQIFEPDQLELLISGITTVDVDELKNATQLSGWKATDPEISWFWRALRSFSQEERSRFLMFVTSSSRVPLGGFTQLQGSSGTQPFQMQKLYAKEGSLPQASTCFNLLLLPTYASYEQLRERLQFAIVETGGFGKA
ncbi:uncharacterized protein L201_006800 [Kwoniella dendrophila CBS 6074]|uniref:HECT-type E3 ubiquitin transferase n=1 Tax=Kwoniella dendrophila CBS 6074 TaxID=1295534 RepID=A0AAX4K3V2_9TREE